VRVLRVTSLDSDLQEHLAQNLLGERAAAFVEELRGSRLYTRLRNPLWLVLAAARFAETSRLPERRVELVERMIANILDRTREARRWEGVESRFATTARTMLEHTALEANSAQAVAKFLRDELEMTAVEAEGQAPLVLRDVAAATGLLVESGGSWVFTSMPVLEHLAACRALKTFQTIESRELLIGRWWNGDEREIALSILGLIESEREVSALLRQVIPISKIRDWFRRTEPATIDRLKFIVDCMLDGVPVDAEMLDRVRRDLEHRARYSQERVIAGEFLAHLGAPK
jgi:hypothetical protein